MSTFCANCGTQVPERARFCGSCGRAVSEGQPTSQQEAPRQQEQPQAWMGTAPSSVNSSTDSGASGQATLAAATRWLNSAGQCLNASQGPSAGSEAAAVGATAASNWRTYLALALLVLAAFANGTANTAIWSKAVGVLWLAATVLLVLDAVKPSLLGRTSAWLRRPRLGAASAAIFVLFAATYAGFSFSFFAAAAGTAVFLWDAHRRGELGPFDPLGLVRGWRVLILAGVLLASFTFSASWLADYNTSGSYTKTEQEGDYEVRYRVNERGTIGGYTGHERNITTLPILLMVALLASAAWRPAGGQPRFWWVRFVPAGLAGALLIWGIYQTVGESNNNAEVTKSNGPLISIWGSGGDGPMMFTIAILPACLAVAVLTLKRNASPMPRTPRG